MKQMLGTRGWAHSLRLTLILLGLSSGLFCVASATADDGEIKSWIDVSDLGLDDVTDKMDVVSLNAVDYLTDFTLDENQIPNATPTREDLWRARTVNTLRYRDFVGESRDQIIGAVGANFDAYDSRSDLNASKLWASGTYRAALSPVLWLGGTYRFEYRTRDQETQSTSHNFATDLRYRPNTSYLTVATARAQLFDYNQYFGAGLDQNRYELSANQYYYPFGDATFLQVGVTGTRTDADASRNSFDRVIVSSLLHYELTDEHAFRANARYLDIDYEGIFNVAQPFSREDNRYEVGVGYRYTYSEAVTAFAEFLYIDNDSNTIQNNYESTRSTVGVLLRF